MVLLYGSLVWVIFLAIPTASAQPSSPTTTSPSSTSTQALASIVPGSAAYGYFGCYNETTSNSNVGNVRALAGGNMTTSDSMTVEQCFAFCGTSTFAGLEYGRECWCSNVLNTYAEKLTNANCSLTCSGDKTEVCGGVLKLTAYQRKANGSSRGGRSASTSRVLLTALFLAILVAH